MTIYDSYPGLPPAPEMPQGPARPPRPAAVNRSVIFWFLAVLMYAAGFVILLTVGASAFSQEIAEVAAASGSAAMSPEEARLVVTLGLVIGGVIAVVMLGLWVLFIMKMRAGRGWARSILTVVGTLYVALQAWTLATTPMDTAWTLTIVTTLLVAAAIVTMWLPGARAYFRR